MGVTWGGAFPNDKLKLVVWTLVCLKCCSGWEVSLPVAVKFGVVGSPGPENPRCPDCGGKAEVRGGRQEVKVGKHG